MKNVPHNRLTFSEDEVSAVAAVLRTGYWAGGPRLDRLEQELCSCFGVSNAVGVGSGLAAIRLALLSLGVGPGDQVIVPAYSCVAIANAVLSLGAEPRPVDVGEESWNIDPAKAEVGLERSTKAIIAVNTFGLPADIAGLKKLGVPVIEDCSHGFAVISDGSVAAIESDLAVISFYATKLIAGGEGGVVLASQNSYGEFVREWRDYSDKTADGTRLNDKMTDIEAALVLEQLNRLGAMLTSRQRLAERYSTLLSGVHGVTTPEITSGRVWYRYVVRVPEGRLRQVTDELAETGVSACSPIEWWPYAEDESFEVAEEACRTCLSLPLYPTLSADEQDVVCARLVEALSA